MSSRPAKRRRVVFTIGAPSEADSPSSQRNVPSSSAFSVRHVQRPVHVQSLTTLCARVFVTYFPHFSTEKNSWQPRREWTAVSQWLDALPDSSIPMLFGMLRASCPVLLSHELVTSHFLRGPSVVLSSDLGGPQPVNKYTLLAAAKLSALVELRLLGFDKILDKGFATIVSGMPTLEVLYLGGCTKVGIKTVEALVQSCPVLKVLNLNYTSVTPASIGPLLLARHEQLAVLKVAGMTTWTDAAFSKLLALLSNHRDFSLPALHTLKLRQSSLSDGTLNTFLPMCPNLRKLDLSFTNVCHLQPTTIANLAGLEKLALTSTRVLPNNLVQLVSATPNLVTLTVGALGGGQGQASAIGNTSSMTMTDSTLSALTQILVNCHELRAVNLVGNTKLKVSLPDFVRLVGRRLKRLNLASISGLKSSDLAGLAPEDLSELPSGLEVLILNGTSVDDDAAPFIARCPGLETLEVAGTKLSNNGLFSIIDGCPLLSNLDVTRCRGVPVAARRRLFEVWDEQRDT
ncbi:RNI-like protein [Auriscalpium vulgare]|uniref:RNI-like protein n=1 Tax=Auriscalpium vulgare TaxID=40419 RepID=A0ACB8SAS4_9AGAM|nr:RNI-like protein [Auriscalpium vulgare]